MYYSRLGLLTVRRQPVLYYSSVHSACLPTAARGGLVLLWIDIAEVTDRTQPQPLQAIEYPLKTVIRVGLIERIEPTTSRGQRSATNLPRLQGSGLLILLMPSKFARR